MQSRELTVKPFFVKDVVAHTVGVLHSKNEVTIRHQIFQQTPGCPLRVEIQRT